jgi:hypothetical protein
VPAPWVPLLHTGHRLPASGNHLAPVNIQEPRLNTSTPHFTAKRARSSHYKLHPRISS